MLRETCFVIYDVQKPGGVEEKLPVPVWSKGKIKFPASETVSCALTAKSKLSSTRGQKTKVEKANGNMVVLSSAVISANKLANEAENAAEAAKLQQKPENSFDAKAVIDAKTFADEARNIANELAAMITEANKPIAVEDSDQPTLVDAPVSGTMETTPQPVSFDNLFDCLVKVDDEWFVRLSDTRMISFAAFTREDGKAIVGETPLGRRSPATYKALAANVAAEIPTAEDFEKLEEVVQNLIKMLNEIFANKVGFENQLIVTSDGKYRTYLGEYKHLLEKFPVYNLASRKVIKG